MTDEEMDKRLREIANVAKKQREGPFSAQSDAQTSLVLIETLTLLLIEQHHARYGPPPGMTCEEAESAIRARGAEGAKA